MNTIQTKNNEARDFQAFTAACLEECGKFIAQLERVKKNIIAEFRDEFESEQLLLAGTIREAEELAWQTDYPQLVFPTLALEKVQNVAGWNARQQGIHRDTGVYAMAA
ncbi:MAG TPA: hypothetical protein VGN23_08995 [Verrucomicrobiae bacterium]|jgi:hypothetical protein